MSVQPYAYLIPSLKPYMKIACKTALKTFATKFITNIGLTIFLNG
jgi:hypothetical protein